MLEVEFCDILNSFLRLWPFELHFLINLSLLKRRVVHVFSYQSDLQKNCTQLFRKLRKCSTGFLRLKKVYSDI